MSEALKEIAERRADTKMPVTAEQTAAISALKQLEPVVRQVIGNTLRGLLVSTPGVAPHLVLNAIAWQTANLLAGAFNADLATSLQLRKAMKDAFDNGVKQAPVQQPTIPIGHKG